MTWEYDPGDDGVVFVTLRPRLNRHSSDSYGKTSLSAIRSMVNFDIGMAPC